MTDWRIARYQNRPLEIDSASSPTTVYERRNIHEVISEYNDEVIAEWECEERTYTKDEYGLLTSPTMKTIMQQLSSLELQIAELGE